MPRKDHMEKNFTFSQRAIERLRVKLTWAQLELVSAKADEFQLIIAGDNDSVNELHIEQTGEDLMVAQPQLAYAKEILPRNRWLQICVCVPESWHGEIDTDSISGTIGARDIAAGDLALSTFAGSMNARGLRADKLWLHTVSGTLTGNGLRAKRMNLRSVSGEINMTDMNAATVKLFTVSGEMNLDMADGTQNIEAQSGSGALTIVAGGAVRAVLHSLSGQYSIEDGEPAEGGSLVVTATSVSGDLTIKRRRNGQPA